MKKRNEKRIRKLISYIREKLKGKGLKERVWKGPKEKGLRGKIIRKAYTKTYKLYIRRRIEKRSEKRSERTYIKSVIYSDLHMHDDIDRFFTEKHTRVHGISYVKKA